jgi:hypothetical protein
MPKQNVVSRLVHAHQHFSKLIDSLSNEQFLSPMNGWAPREVVAHLIGWNGRMIESSQSILAGNPPSYYEDAPNDYSNVFITIEAGITYRTSVIARGIAAVS